MLFRSQARYNMVEQQIRPWDVMDSRVLSAINDTPRHHFVTEAQQSLAYMDLALPIGEGQQMMEPRLEARVLQALELQKNETVLEIGTGSGYVTTLLCKLAGSVRSIDYFNSLTEQAKDRLSAAQVGNYILESGDALSSQWNPGSVYDIVLLTGAVTTIPNHLKKLVKNGGRLLAPVEKDGVKSITLVTRIETDSWLTESLFETEVANLISPRSSSFVF